MRILYTFALYIAYPFLYFKLKKRFGKEYFKQRKNPTVEGSFDCIIHAASVGEQVLVAPVVDSLVKKGKRILLTCATDTGLEKAKSNFGESENVEVCYFPFDFPSSLKVFFSKVKAKSLILVETELWPNSIFYAEKNNLKIFLINGRISDKSLKNYKRFSFFLKKLFAKFEKVLVRTEKDGRRFEEIGCPPEKIKVCGNLKLANPPKVREKISIKSSSPVFVLGSTRDYEEELIIEYLKDLIEEGRITPAFAPRHPERTDEVAQAVKKFGFNPVFSKGKSEFELKKGDILIVNETGRLVDFYAVADFCFVGGSLADFGGQNFAEPVFLGKPVIVGKFLSNFEDLKEVLSDYVFIAESPSEFKFLVENFLEKPEYFKAKAEEGKKTLEKNSQSLECVLGEIEC